MRGMSSGWADLVVKNEEGSVGWEGASGAWL